MRSGRSDDPRELVESFREGITAAVVRHKGRSVAIFGSVARGDHRPDSDIDFLVEFEEGSSLFDLMRLTDELSESSASESTSCRPAG